MISIGIIDHKMNDRIMEIEELTTLGKEQIISECKKLIQELEESIGKEFYPEMAEEKE